MANPNPEHLLDQARTLFASSSAGAPRQVDLRRSISTSYYAVFHFLLAALADEFAGASTRGTPRYALVYRRLSHNALQDLCSEVIKQSPSRRYRPFRPPGGFADDLQACANAVTVLQEQRHDADYDPEPRFFVADAQSAHQMASDAIHRFDRIDDQQRKIFLTLLLCPPR